MNTKKATKRALLTSVMALVMCVVMLVGTTFAWFTDTASTAVNKIQAGNLNVALEMWNGEKWVDAENQTLNFLQKQSDGSVKQEANILWEPGCTYELPKLRVINKGNLALKYTIEITGINGDAKLNDAIDWTIGDITLGNTFTSLNVGANKEFTIKGHMQETAGNEYQGLSINGIGITVFATQDTVEFDSFDDQYDKDAPIVYPAGVTSASFDGATSVYYYGTYGGGSNIRVATGADIANHPATVAYMGAAGIEYAADVYCAIEKGATTIYCKQNATLKMRSVGTNRTPDLTSDLTIYANGADFQYGEIALNSTTTAANDITVKIYDAKNLYVWGYSPAEGKTATVLMENCHNVGTSATNTAGRMFYISNNSGRGNGTIDVTLRNCSVEKSDSPVYMNADGSMILENCTFIECAVPVNNNYKSNGTRTDAVKNCTFIRCGCTDAMNSGIAAYAAPIRFVKSGSGTLNVTLEGNTFTGTIGTNGDILLGDYRTGKTSNPFTAEIVTDHAVMVKSSAGEASSCNSGTINVASN